MAQPQTIDSGAPQSDVAVMENFIQEHGAPPQEAQAPKPGREQTPPETNFADEDGDNLSFDADTLAKLGLVPDDHQPDDGDSGSAGSEAADIDLAPLARHLGVSEDELSFRDGEIQVRTKVDGETATVPLSKLREGYQLRQHFTRQQEQFLEERRQWEAAREQQAGEFQQRAQMADQVLNQQEQELKQAYTRDWTALRQEDPAEYAAQVAEYNQKLGEIRQRRQGLMQTMQQRQQEMMQQYQYHQQVEAQRLAEATGWVEPEKFQQNGQRLRNYLTQKVGFSDMDISSVGDHRALLVAEKARRFDELMEKVQTSRKQVKEAHPMPSGNAATPRTGKRKKLDQAKGRLARDGSLEAAASVFEELGI